MLLSVSSLGVRVGRFCVGDRLYSLSASRPEESRAKARFGKEKENWGIGEPSSRSGVKKNYKLDGSKRGFLDCTWSSVFDGGHELRMVCWLQE